MTMSPIVIFILLFVSKRNRAVGGAGPYGNEQRKGEKIIGQTLIRANLIPRLQLKQERLRWKRSPGSLRRV